MMKNCWPIQHGQFQNECVEIENPMKSIHIIIMYKNARETFFPAENSHHSLRLFLFLWFERKSKFFITFNFFLWIAFSSWTNAIIHLHKNE